MSYAATGALDTAPSCGDNAVLDPFTHRCHCIGGMVHDPRTGGQDCVDPSVPCTGQDEVWDEASKRCILQTAPMVVNVPAGARSSPVSLWAPASVGGSGQTAWLLGGALVGSLVLYMMDRSKPPRQRLLRWPS